VLSLLLLALTAPLEPALLTASDVAPDCQLTSTQPLDPHGGGVQLGHAGEAVEQVLSCNGDVGIVDYFETGKHAEEGVRELEEARWGGPQPPARLHDGLLRHHSVLADVSGSRAVVFLLQTKLQAKEFQSLGGSADFGAIAQAMAEERAEHAPPLSGRLDPSRVDASGIEWLGYEDALREAASSRRPVCLYFSTTWCPHCRNFEKNVLRDPGVAQKSKAFVMVKLDDEKEDALARKYSPDGRYFPRVLFLSPDGVLDPSLTNGSHGGSRYTVSESDPRHLMWMMDSALAKIGNGI
jgi:protein-disulfide reductase (glutathione)